MINIALWDTAKLIAVCVLVPTCAYLLYKFAQLLDEVVKEWRVDRILKETKLNIWEEGKREKDER